MTILDDFEPSSLLGSPHFPSSEMAKGIQGKSNNQEHELAEKMAKI
jgi:hypothetical protein